MKHKIVMFLLVFVLVMTFAVTANASTIKEDTSTYAGNGDVYIIGSSKFSSNIIITGRMIGVAGARETIIQYMIYNNWDFDPDDLEVYYYNDLTKTWKKLPQTSEDTIQNLTPEETRKLTENLNIYYENQEEKTVEVPYEVNPKEGYKLVAYTYDSQNNRVEIEYKNGKLQIPATATYIETYFVNEQDEEDAILLDQIEQNENNFEESSTIVSTLAELKKAIADKKEDIRLDANILDITETITIPYQVKLNGAGYKLAFKDIQKTSNNPVASGLVIAGDWSYITNLTIEMDAKAGWQGNYGLQVYGAQNVTIENYTGTKADAALLVNGSNVTLRENINLTGNEFGGIEVSKGSNTQLQNSNLIIDNAKIIMNDETISKPVVWLEKNQGTVNGTTLIPNENIPTVAGKSQVFYYSNAKVFQNVEVSTYEELKFAMNCVEVENIKLLKDITIPTVVVVNKTVTLDLNGHTIKNETDIWDEETKAWSLISVRQNGDLTITGNGTLKAKANDCYAVDLQEGGKVTINNGRYVGNIAAVYVKEGTATINGGTYAIQQLDQNHPYGYVLNCYDENYRNGIAKIVVKGGSFEEFDPANNVAEGEGTNFLAPGLRTELYHGNYTVVENN